MNGFHVTTDYRDIGAGKQVSQQQQISNEIDELTISAAKIRTSFFAINESG